jgi:carboxylesterase type B
LADVDYCQLGFNAPNGSTNFALRDVVASLEFLHKVAPSFGGDASKITIAGQSSGANMIRAILAAPSVSSLFRSAILQSDPMVSELCVFAIGYNRSRQDYGFLSTSIQSTLQDYFNEQVNCSATDTSCATSLTLDAILSASDNLYENAVTLDPAATPDEPMRPVYDGDLITSTLDSTTPFPKVSKSIILSTVLNEAGPTIYTGFTSPVNASSYEEVILASFAEPEASNLLQAPYYQVSPNATDTRPQLEEFGTDRIWRCSSWSFARSWTQNGGNAYVAQYTVGATYPDNQNVTFCTQPGNVCHEDDVEIVVRHSIRSFS